MPLAAGNDSAVLHRAAPAAPGSPPRPHSPLPLHRSPSPARPSASHSPAAEANGKPSHSVSSSPSNHSGAAPQGRSVERSRSRSRSRSANEKLRRSLTPPPRRRSSSAPRHRWSACVIMVLTFKLHGATIVSLHPSGAPMHMQDFSSCWNAIKPMVWPWQGSSCSLRHGACCLAWRRID